MVSNPKPKYALLIGANYYNDPSSRLQGCIDDIVGMKTLLVNNYGYLPANITMLRDDTNDRRIKPTRINIMQAMETIVNRSGNASEIWVHFSGHGATVVKRIGKNISREANCIVPIDWFNYYGNTGLIKDNELYSIFSKSKCPTMILMDSCFSGGVCNLQYDIEYIQDNSFNTIRTRGTVLANKNIYQFGGSKQNQTSADFYDQDDQQFEGAFTDAFLDCLRDASYNIDIKSLEKNICNKLSHDLFLQKPILSSSTNTPTYVFTPASSSVSRSSIGNSTRSFVMDFVPPLSSNNHEDEDNNTSKTPTLLFGIHSSSATNVLRNRLRLF